MFTFYQSFVYFWSANCLLFISFTSCLSTFQFILNYLFTFLKLIFDCLFTINLLFTFSQLFVYFFSATILTFANVVFTWGVRISTPSIASLSPVKQLFLPAGRVGAGIGHPIWSLQLWWPAQFCLMDRLLKNGHSVSNLWEFLLENLGLIGNVQFCFDIAH